MIYLPEKIHKQADEEDRQVFTSTFTVRTKEMGLDEDEVVQM